MFRKKHESAERLATEHFKTLIDASTSVEGRIDFRESLRIDGKVAGSICLEPGSKATIAIAEGAVVRGDVHAFRVLVAGFVQGNIHAIERVELLNTAHVCGDIAYGSISVLHGAKVAGKLLELAHDGEAAAPGRGTDALLVLEAAPGPRDETRED